MVKGVFFYGSYERNIIGVIIASERIIFLLSTAHLSGIRLTRGRW